MLNKQMFDNSFRNKKLVYDLTFNYKNNFITVLCLTYKYINVLNSLDDNKIILQ